MSYAGRCKNCGTPYMDDDFNCPECGEVVMVALDAEPSLADQLAAAEARVKELEEVLEWYASICAWKGEYLGRDRRGLSEYDTSPASRDLGERARKALKGGEDG